MKKQHFSVSGMSCAACSAHVEKAVERLVGVKSVAVNLLSNDMTVEFDETVLSIGDIEKAVFSAGYGASVSGNVGAGSSCGVGLDGSARSGGCNNGKGSSVAERKFGSAKSEGGGGLSSLITSFILLFALMYFSMGNMMWGFPAPAAFDHKQNPVGFALIQFVLLLPIIYIYRNYFYSGFKKLFKGAPNMDTLVAIGSSVSVIYGAVALFIMSYYSSKLALGGVEFNEMSRYKSIIEHYCHNLYFESAAMILTLVSFGKYLEGVSKRKTTKAVEALAALAPKTAIVLVGGEEREIPVEEVKVGDVLVLKKGAIVAVDGVVESGSISVDQSNITGESFPVMKGGGEEIFASTTVTAGYCTMRAVKVGEDTSFAAIVRLVEEAANSKAPVSRLADKISAYFVPTILIISVLTFAFNLIFGGDFERALNFAVTVVVIACPCALGLATPVAIMVGTGKGAQLGLIIKNAEILEKTKSIDTVVLDKTGTLTEGKPTVTDYFTVENEMEVLGAVYAIERMSEHPLAGAVCEFAEQKGACAPSVSDYFSIDGCGLCASVCGVAFAIGNSSFEERGAVIDDCLKATASGFAKSGKTPLFIYKNNVAIGIIAVKDNLKKDSESAVNELIARDIDVIMLTGDNRATAQAIAGEVGIKRVISDVLPQDKQGVIEDLKNEGRFVAMVGDGVNDAPALTAADIGIAVGGGSEVAVSAGDVVLIKNELFGVATAIDLSKRVLGKIKLGLFWAFFYNAVCVFLATGIPYYLWNFAVTPMIGAIAMSFSSVSVVLNALSINTFKPKKLARYSKKCDQTDQNDNNFGDGVKVDEDENNYVKGENITMKTIIKVNGMMCAHCVAHVEKAALSVEGVTYAKADLDKKQVEIETNGDCTALVKQRIVEAGYEIAD